MTMNKQRPDRSIAGFIPAIVVLIAFLISMIYFGMRTAYNVIGLGFWAVGIIQLICYTKTRSTGYLISTLYLAFIGTFVFSLDIDVLLRGEKLSNTSALLGVITLFLMGWLLYLMFTRQIKWKGREVFELAARSIHDTSNGFTERPKPAGKADYSLDELLGFSRFLEKKLVCLSYYDGNRMILAPVRFGKEYGMVLSPGNKLLQRSWISFNTDGIVTVNITRKDYMTYQDTLSFDQLCDSMGKLFIDFLELYKRGEGEMILNRLDALKLSLFT